jgi:hypothetical protein
MGLTNFNMTPSKRDRTARLPAVVARWLKRSGASRGAGVGPGGAGRGASAIVQRGGFRRAMNHGWRGRW